MKQLTYLLTLLFLVSCHQEESTDVKIDVSLHTKDNLTTPLVVKVSNNTQYAEEYLWTFEGGEPATSTKKDPGEVTFTTPGEHKIALEAWNQTDRASQTYTVRVDSLVTADFAPEVIINNYAPAEFKLLNLSKGGSNYKWIMEGAETETAEGFSPQSITYSQPGVYTIILVVDNGSNLVTVSKEVEVKESLDASFSILPSFEDIDDMEAPLRATFDVYQQGVETLKWECEGATFTDPTSADAMMLIPTAGTHTVYLEVSNGKQTKRVSQQITVKQNTNLRTHHNVRFGISTATSSIGAFYSTKLRQTVKDGDLNVVNGSLIDIAFFGFDNTFTRNMFVSPDQVSQTTLVDIPNASKTYFINKQELTNINLSIEQFESMITDAVLKTLSIKSNSSNNELFSNEPMPRVILFETTDGRKGAILVKQMIQIDATSSYILTDIKIQKND